MIEAAKAGNEEAGQELAVRALDKPGDFDEAQVSGMIDFLRGEVAKGKDAARKSRGAGFVICVLNNLGSAKSKSFNTEHLRCLIFEIVPVLEVAARIVDYLAHFNVDIFNEDIFREINRLYNRGREGSIGSLKTARDWLITYGKYRDILFEK